MAAQPFSNPTTSALPNSRFSKADCFESASPVRSADGYVPEAMLFVDEAFADTTVARTTRLGGILWKPCVRFCSSHYRYERNKEGPYLIQVGIGADKHDFRAPPPPKVAAAEARI